MRKFSVLLLVLLLLIAVSGSADEAAEKSLMKEADAHITTIVDPATDEAARTTALRQLASVYDRMKAVADADQNFAERSWQDEFKGMYEDMDPFLEEEAKKRGVTRRSLTDPAAQEPAVANRGTPGMDPSRKGCGVVPIPEFPPGTDRRQIADELAKATDALREHLAKGRGESFQEIAARTAERDRLQKEMILNQVRLAFEAGGPPSARELIDLKHKNDRLFEALERKATKDKRAKELLGIHEEYRLKFNALQQQHAQGGHWTGAGGTAVGTGPLSWWAQKLANEIQDLWKQSNADYQEYLDYIEPVEAGARKLFNEQVQKGIEAINYRLKQQHPGDGDPPRFELYRPKTGNHRDLLNNIIGSWLKLELGLHPMRSASPWPDWDQYKDFDYGVAGKQLSSGPACARPEEKAAPEPEKPPEKPAAKPTEESSDCSGGGLLGNMNCVEKRIDRGY